MKKIEDISLVVQARLSSERCPRKMIRPFAGTTLMDICLEKLVASNIPNENIWISLYDEELKDLCSKYPVNIFHRSQRSAESEGYPLNEIFEWWDKIPHKYTVLVNACVPFLSVNSIEKFFSNYANSSLDGMFGVIEKRDYFWDHNNNSITSNGSSSMNTKMADVVKQAAHCLYAGRLDSIGRGIWMGDLDSPGSVDLCSIPENECLDIDHEWQFKMCESLYSSFLNTGSLQCGA